MELRQLRCFIEVADTLHFGRAAQNLEMLPASLGRQIKILEDALGTRLLERTTRNVTLTSAGASFLKDARDIVERADQLFNQFRDKQRETISVLRVGAIDSAAAGLIPQLLPHFRELYPEIDMQLLEQKTIRLLPRLLSGRLDIAFVRPPDVTDPRIVFRPLFYETAVVAIPEGHHLAALQSVSVEEMADEPLIVPDRRSRPHSHDLSIKLFVEAGIVGPHCAGCRGKADYRQYGQFRHRAGHRAEMGLAAGGQWGALRSRHRCQRNCAKYSGVICRLAVGGTRDSVRDKFLNVLDRQAFGDQSYSLIAVIVSKFYIIQQTLSCGIGPLYCFPSRAPGRC